MVIFRKTLGEEDSTPKPEPDHPCPDFFDTCCLLASPTIVATKSKPPIGIPDRCGIRNKNGAVFEVNERDNEAQFGEFRFFSKFL